MLANVLAVLLGLGSFIFYTVAFLYPEVHRRSDFVWSGLGLLYAVDLWFSAEQMTPAVLLGQAVAVALLIGLGWQTLVVRREKTPVYQQTPVVLTPDVVGDWTKSKLNQLRIAPSETVRPATLKDRPLTGATTERLRRGLNQSLDPRRRPLYDYEFVEDGSLESAVHEVPEVSLEELEAVVSRSEQIDPPFAIAEVIAIQSDESSPPKSPQPEVSNSKETGIEAPETEPPETEATEIKATEIETAELAASEPESAEPEVSEAETKPTEVSEPVAIDEDWGDELDPPVPEATAYQVPTAKTVQKPLQKKPSLLAIPVIFLGWIKDVAQSLTKPKPSKPVIDIPRREPPLPIKDSLSIKDNLPTEEDSDDSNWID